MKKIVIFGATGNLGAYVVDYFLENFDRNEFEIIAVGRRKTDFFNKLGVKYFQVDISKKEITLITCINRAKERLILKGKII